MCKRAMKAFSRGLETRGSMLEAHAVYCASQENRETVNNFVMLRSGGGVGSLEHVFYILGVEYEYKGGYSYLLATCISNRTAGYKEFAAKLSNA